MTTQTDLQELDRQLIRIACQAVIYQAASMLNADHLADADAYKVMGADEILCRPDESIATAAERYAYQRHCCCRDQGIPHDDLTLLDCLRWICAGEGDDQQKDEDDAVSLDEVLTVAGLPLLPAATDATGPPWAP